MRAKRGNPEAFSYLNSQYRDKNKKKIISLPKGQAFVWVNGGELYKITMLLSLNETIFLEGIESILKQMKKTLEPSSTLCEPIPIREKVTPISDAKIIDEFTQWLVKRMNSGQKQF